MSDKSTLLSALQPVLERISTLDPAAPDAAQILNAALPVGGEALSEVERLVREGVEQGWFAPRGEPGLRFGRISKPAPESLDLAIDAVDMDRPGPAHTHPRGEFDLCFPLSGAPTFDGHPPGWVVLPPGSWHVPTVAGGRMAILYFLPGGAFQMGPESAPS